MEPVARNRSPILVAREDELDQLRRLLVRAARGTPGTLLVRGEVGAGKTRLLDEFADNARASGALVVRGSCIALGTGEIPYAPLVEGLRRLVRDLGEKRARRLAGFSGLTSLIAGLLESGPPAPTAAGLSAQSGVFAAILGLLDELGSAKAVVLIMEDLQWADPSSLDLLAYLARTKTGERLLLIGSYRTTDLEPGHPLRTLVAELDLGRSIDQMEVPQFGRPGVRALLRAIMETEPDHDLVERVLEMSDGNAFFVEELLAAGMTADVGPVPVPPTVRDLVLTRFAHLDRDAQDVMRVVATAGREVSAALLSKVSDLPDRQLMSTLRHCVDSQLLTYSQSDDTYRFRHAIMREAVHEDLQRSERVSLHRVIAGALAADSQLSLADQLTVAAELSYHWYEAGNYPQALTAAVQAGDHAMSLHAFRDASKQYARALSVWPRLDTAAEIAGVPKARLLISAADADRWAGRIRQAVELAQDAVSEVDPISDPELAGEMYERLGSYQWEAGDHAASERAYAEAGLLLDGQAPSAAAARVLAMRASKEVRDGFYVEGLATGQTALAMAESVGARPEQGRALMWIGAARIMQGGEVDAGVEDLLQAARIAESEHQLEDLHRAYGNLAYALENAGRLEQSLTVALEGLDLIRQTEVGHTRGYGLLANNACAAMVQLGRWDEATAILTELLVGRPVAESLFPRLTLAEIEVARGHDAAAAALLAEVRSAGGSVTQPQFIASLCTSAAEAAIWSGRHEMARAAVADGLRAISDTQHAVAVLRLCALGLRNEADEWLVRSAAPGTARRDPSLVSRLGALMAEADRVHDPLSKPVLPDVVALHRLCAAERSRVDGTDQVSLWSHAAKTWNDMARPYQAAYAWWREAEAAAGTPGADAHLPAAAAHEVAQRLDAGPLREAISALAQRIQLVLETGPNDPVRPDQDVAPESPSDPYRRLTPRELEVLALVCTGKTNVQIGIALGGISAKTVSVHVTNLMCKLDVTNRSAAAVKATQLKFFPPDE